MSEQEMTEAEAEAGAAGWVTFDPNPRRFARLRLLRVLPAIVLMLIGAGEMTRIILELTGVLEQRPSDLQLLAWAVATVIVVLQIRELVTPSVREKQAEHPLRIGTPGISCGGEVIDAKNIFEIIVREDAKNAPSAVIQRVVASSTPGRRAGTIDVHLIWLRDFSAIPSMENTPGLIESIRRIGAPVVLVSSARQARDAIANALVRAIDELDDDDPRGGRGIPAERSEQTAQRRPRPAAEPA